MILSGGMAHAFTEDGKGGGGTSIILKSTFDILYFGGKKRTIAVLMQTKESKVQQSLLAFCSSEFSAT